MSKVWTASSIRQLARARAAAAEESANTVIPTSRQAFLESLEENPAPKSRKNPPQSKDNDEDFRPEWIWESAEKNRGTRVHLIIPRDALDGGEEIRLLCGTLGFDCVDTTFLSTHRKPDPATYAGRGKLEDLNETLGKKGVEVVVIDAPLSPSQVRNIEQIVKRPVLDRHGLILSIFQEHAQSKLAQMQVELARLKYLQPRLSGLWSGLSRQSGGKGGLGGRGLGETRLELDRRVVKDRIAYLARKLKTAEKAVEVQSSKRSSLPRVALVGYTNAGKSTIMRGLTKAPVAAENKLFCTLDTTVRPLVPPTEPRILVSDTVGFVRELPHELVASFKSTLREALESQLILHVVDVSHPQWREQFETTEAVLEEIGAVGLPRILVMNKCDLVRGPARMKLSQAARLLGGREENYVGRVWLSALNGEGFPELREALLQHFHAENPVWSRNA